MSQRWRDVSDDPNSAESLAVRRQQMDGIWSTESRTRFEFIVDHCRGVKVLDLGCVDHRITTLEDARWLHQAVRKVAAECVGADYDSVGIEQMTAAGLDAVCVDITAGLGPLASRAPFDVVVAGELIEHLACPQALLSFAREALRPGGKLIISTPNPYAPGRVRGGRRHLAFENVDHVVYIFPAGLIEMADRTGLVLRTATTLGYDNAHSAIKRSFEEYARGIKRRLRGEPPTYTSKRQTTGRLRLPLHPNYVTPGESIRLLLSPLQRAGAFLGETAIYVLEKPDGRDNRAV